MSVQTTEAEEGAEKPESGRRETPSPRLGPQPSRRLPGASFPRCILDCTAVVWAETQPTRHTKHGPLGRNAQLPKGSQPIANAMPHFHPRGRQEAPPELPDPRQAPLKRTRWDERM